MQLYEINDRKIKSILNDIETDIIAMPEIQRPFVWDTTKVRDLIDSIYRGFPIGYIITSNNPDIRTKGGGITRGKTLIIDGQQRLTALRAAILGERIVDDHYRKRNIRISFNPKTEVFETQTPAIIKSKDWIPDISIVLNENFDSYQYIQQYCEQNTDVSPNDLNKILMKLQNSIMGNQIGYISLSHKLDVDIVSEIFVRINSKGAQLNQADFAMSKIAAHNERGSNLRKLIDYFSHLVLIGSDYDEITANDPEFSQTEHFKKISWLKDDKSSLYDPDYSDIMRVAFSSQYNRGKLADLVSLLSGRNFEKKIYEEEIIEDTLNKLEAGVLDVVRESNFTSFLQIIDGAGFVDNSLISSQNVLNFAYILYLNMKQSGESPSIIQRTVAKWFVMSTLTGRYSSSPETAFDRDLRDIAKKGAGEMLIDIEAAELSDTFWNVGLLQDMDRATITHPYINTFFAAQIHAGDRGFLSQSVSLRSIKDIKGDIHHIFPKDYLRKNGFDSRSDYNQIANFVYIERAPNIQIGNKPPEEYMKIVMKQCEDEKCKIGDIHDAIVLNENLRQNCIPSNLSEMTAADYPEFLKERRKLMVYKIKRYYEGL